MVGLVVLFFLYLLMSQRSSGVRVPFWYFENELEARNVKSVKAYGEILTGKLKKIPSTTPPDVTKMTDEFNTILPEGVTRDPKFWENLRAKGVEVDAESREPSYAQQTIFWVIIWVLLILFLIYMLRRNVDPLGGGMMGNFIRSQAKRFQPSDQRTTFEDVAAMEQAKLELQEIVEFLKNPGKFERLGAQIPKGVLLMGPPGTGKTLLARAVAGEAGVPFYSINGSEFIQMFVGVGASRVRDLFRTAKENAPCILFIDEIDAVGRERGAGFGGGHDEREQTLNQILSEMDGFQQNEAVIVLAATNRPDVLDPALLRPGRFDRHVTIDRPTREGRAAILKVHVRKVPLADDVDLETIASGTIGFSGADLRNLVNEAALLAARTSKNAVEMDDFEQARDKILLGPLREDILNEDEKEITAYHESGHALLAWLLPEVDLIHKVTIIPRGRSLGVTQLLPDEERYNAGEKRLHSQLAFILGGRAAEKMMFDEYSAGAEDDLRQATQLARRMVAHWGMSEVIGPVAFRQGEEHPFLGKEIHEQRKFSEETARIIDQEVQRFLTNAQERAVQLVSDHRESLDRLAHALLERESLGQAELKQILGERAGKENGKESDDLKLPYPSSITP
jgi:cell division protease FtsH